MQAFAVTASRVIVVQYTSANPETAKDVANALANQYILFQQAAKLQSNDDATGWLAPEIDDLRNRVRDAEKKVADYRASRGLLTGQSNSTIATQQLSEVSTELTRVRTSRASAEAKAESIRKALASGAPIDTLPDVVASGMMQRLAEGVSSSMPRLPIFRRHFWTAIHASRRCVPSLPISISRSGPKVASLLQVSIMKSPRQSCARTNSIAN